MSRTLQVLLITMNVLTIIGIIALAMMTAPGDRAPVWMVAMAACLAIPGPIWSALCLRHVDIIR